MKMYLHINCRNWYMLHTVNKTHDFSCVETFHEHTLYVLQACCIFVIIYTVLIGFTSQTSNNA